MGKNYYNRFRTKEKALEIPKLALYIGMIDRTMTQFFSQINQMSLLFSEKKEIRNELFYVEQSLSAQLSKLPSALAENISSVAQQMYRNQ